MSKMPQTTNKHDFWEALSAFQKAIRRSQMDDALYWGVDLYLSGFARHVWQRMRIIASEDIGIADRNLPLTLDALYRTWLDLEGKSKGQVSFFDVVDGKEEERETNSRLQFVHAILLLVTAPKLMTP
jgi:hypothetical protein